MPASVWTFRNSQRGLTRKVSSLVILSRSLAPIGASRPPLRWLVGLGSIERGPAQRREGAGEDRTAARFPIRYFVVRASWYES